MEYLHGGDIYTYEGVTDYSVNLNPLGPSEQMLAAMRESLTHAGEYPDSRCSASQTIGCGRKITSGWKKAIWSF